MSEQPPVIPPEPRPYSASNTAISKQRKWLLFVVGFLGWYLVNGAIWLLFPINQEENAFFVLLTLPANILLLLFLAFFRRTRWVSFGALAAIALNMLISLVLGMFFESLCLLPFFSPR